MSKKRILLIEDEENTATQIKLQAELLGYRLYVEVDGINGFRAIEREKPDLVILDLMLPGQNGYDICRKMKNTQELKNIPIIILSAKNDEFDVVLGLELGADDFVTKPFSYKILFSRIKSVLRRNKDTEKNPKIISFGDFTLEVDRYLLRKNDMIIPLTLSEFGILRRLVANRGKVLTRSQLIEDVHNENSFIVDRNIDVHIASLRKKLGINCKWIETVRGIGYRFTKEDLKIKI